eukprot:TRINITY_DN32590_c0_g1_i1.p1 TRINITY_DN32590_c0_g1~~TRINITY_DN32590_c0_g1_i1.p1  ORF type:complete len:369 (+),score=135.23 TRINITY_DN32590_c0_g1_i1:48-1154(+)
MPEWMDVGGGKRSYRVKGNTIEVDEKYDVFQSVGFGAYGVVCAGVNTQLRKRVAIKKMPKVFMDLVDGKRILREIILMRYMEHENVLKMLDLLRPREGKDKFSDVYVITDLMETDLHQVIRSKQTLSVEHIQYMIYQVLRALAYCHAAGVVHRDLKPGNLLLNANCDLKLCDFGLARGGLEDLDHPDGLELTDYVVTRWYRPPELLMMCNYGAPIDMWSCGCILAELVNRKALFPGSDYINQLSLIINVLGTPTADDTSFVRSEEARGFLRKMSKKKARPWPNVVPNATRDCLDMISNMVHFNPQKRLTACEALQHPFVAHLYEPSDNHVTLPDKNAFNWDFDDRDLTQQQLRDLLWREICLFHPRPG